MRNKVQNLQCGFGVNAYVEYFTIYGNLSNSAYSKISLLLNLSQALKTENQVVLTLYHVFKPRFKKITFSSTWICNQSSVL